MSSVVVWCEHGVASYFFLLFNFRVMQGIIGRKDLWSVYGGCGVLGESMMNLNPWKSAFI